MRTLEHDFPLKLNAPRAWRTYTGGANLDLLHGKEKGEVTQFPEEWIMSVVAARNAGREAFKEEGMSHLTEHGGLALKELIEQDPEYYLGAEHAKTYGAQLGVLVKLIDSAERLTVQVHPDQETAFKLFGSRFGKTESWHILDVHPVGGEPPCIYIGFRPGITKSRWKQMFDMQDIEGMLSCMHRIQVKRGDTILIQGGVPHAIGAGCFLAEVQEPTDYTIRIERVTPAGLAIPDSMCHQGLGFERMFDCFQYEGVTEEEAVRRWFVKPRQLESGTNGTRTSILGYDTTRLFCLDEIRAEKNMAVQCPPVFSGIYVLEGKGLLLANGKSREIEKAEQYFIPAGVGTFEIQPEKNHPLRILRFMGPQVSLTDGISSETVLDFPLPSF